MCARLRSASAVASSTARANAATRRAGIPDIARDFARQHLERVRDLSVARKLRALLRKRERNVQVHAAAIAAWAHRGRPGVRLVLRALQVLGPQCQVAMRVPLRCPAVKDAPCAVQERCIGGIADQRMREHELAARAVPDQAARTRLVEARRAAHELATSACRSAGRQSTPPAAPPSPAGQPVESREHDARDAAGHASPSALSPAAG